MHGMPSGPQTVPAEHPLGQRLAAAALYPLRGAALAALAGLALAHALVDLLPGIINLAGGVLVWASIILYAMQCLRRTADGYVDAPEVTLYSNYGPAVSMLVLQVLGFIGLVLALKGIPAAWMMVLALVLVLPAIAMSLAFEDHLLAALDPLRWGKVFGAFGPAYLLPVAIGIAEYLAYVGYLSHGGWVGRSFWFAAVVYLCLLQFHVVGILMHRHHAKLGHTPESDTLADASGRDADDHLLLQARTMAGNDQHDAAETLLRERLRERHPPLAVFAAHRSLLRRRGDREALLAWAHTHLNRMLDEDRLRQALGLVGECIELDPDFMPEHPATAARLADAAADQGMTRLALKLARGYPNTWPRDPKAPDYGLLAARLLAERMQQTAEAGVLAGKLLRAYPDHSARARIEQFLHGLGMHPDGPDEASS
jgi:hypothetical protein